MFRYPFLLLIAVLLVGCLSACATHSQSSAMAMSETQSFAMMTPDEDEPVTTIEGVQPCERFIDNISAAEKAVNDIRKNYVSML